MARVTAAGHAGAHRRPGLAPGDGRTVPAEAAKARWFGEYVASAWEDLGRPCPEVVAEQALRYAAAREAAFDPRRAVLVHGDARPFNLLQVPDMPGGSASSIPKELPPSPRWSWA